MLAALSIVAASPGYRAFSCDTANLTIGTNIFSGVPCPTRRGASCPDGAGRDADPLGPCMPNASELRST